MNLYLTRAKVSVLGEILRDAGQVFFASILIDPLVGQSASWLSVVAGLILCIVCWVLSFLITK